MHLKKVSLFLILSMFAQDLVWATGGVSLHVSPQIAVPRENRSGSDQKLIVHVQDAHASLSAQKNISNLLDSLVQQYNIRLIAVEGSSGAIDLSLLANFPDAGARRRLADDLLRKTQISGAEHYAVVSGKPASLVGVEDESLYKTNLREYRSYYRRMPEARAEAEKFEAHLEALQKRIWSEDTQRLWSHSQSWAEGQGTPFRDYWKLLEKARDGRRLKISVSPSIRYMDRALRLEPLVNFELASRERADFIAALSQRGSKRELELLTKLIQSFRSQKINELAFHARLVAMSRKPTPGLKAYPHFLLYTHYLKLSERIDFARMLQALAPLENAALRRTAATRDARMLLRLSIDAKRVAKLIKQEWSGDDYAYVSRGPGLPNLDHLNRGLRFLSRRTGLVEDRFADLSRLKEFTNKAVPFYDAAYRRNAALVHNTMMQMKHREAGKAVLISGGFHTDGMADLFEKDGYSQVVLMPKMSPGKSDERPYAVVLTRKPSEVERGAAGYDAYLAPSSLYGQKGLAYTQREMNEARALHFARLVGYAYRGEALRFTREGRLYPDDAQKYVNALLGPQREQLHMWLRTLRVKHLPKKGLDIRFAGRRYFTPFSQPDAMVAASRAGNVRDLTPFVLGIFELTIAGAMLFGGYGIALTAGVWLAYRSALSVSWFLHETGHAWAKRLAGVADPRSILQQAGETFTFWKNRAQNVSTSAPEAEISVRQDNAVRLAGTAASTVVAAASSAAAVLSGASEAWIAALGPMVVWMISLYSDVLPVLAPKFAARWMPWVQRGLYYCGVVAYLGDDPDGALPWMVTVPKYLQFSRVLTSAFVVAAFALNVLLLPFLFLLPHSIENLLEDVGFVTRIRGEQAAGSVYDYMTATGLVSMALKRLVNRKRADLPSVLKSAMRLKEIYLMLFWGASRMSTGAYRLLAHYRFLTEGEQSVQDTHPHNWMIKKRVTEYLLVAGRLVRRMIVLVTHLAHNGDKDAFRMPRWGIEISNFNKSIQVSRGLRYFVTLILSFGFVKTARFVTKVIPSDLSDVLNAYCHTNVTKLVDSSRFGIIEMMLAQGMWDAAVRWAYFDAVPRSVAEAIAKAPSKRELKAWAKLMDETFVLYRADLEALNLQSLSEVPDSVRSQLLRDFKTHFDTDARFAALRKRVGDQNRDAFLEEMMSAFFDYDPDAVIKMASERMVGTAGMAFITSKDRAIHAFAKGQTLGVGIREDGLGVLIASDPAALKVRIGRSRNAKEFRYQISLRAGEMVRAEMVPAAAGSRIQLEIYSEAKGRRLTQEELTREGRIVDIQNNPLVTPLPPRLKHPMDRDIADIPQVMQRIDEAWSDGDSFVRRTTRSLAQAVLSQRAHEDINRPHLVLAGKEINLWAAEDSAGNLRAICETLSVEPVSSNKFLDALDAALSEFNRNPTDENRRNLKVRIHSLHRDMKVDADTPIVFLSQSGETLPTAASVEAMQRIQEDALARNNELFRSANVFVLTAEMDSEMGKSSGQSYAKEAPFVERIVTSFAGRRVSQAATVSDLAQRYTLSKLELQLILDMHALSGEHRPFGMVLTPDDVEEVQRVERENVVPDMLDITGQAPQSEAPDSIHRKLMKLGKRWGADVLEMYHGLLGAIGIYYVLHRWLHIPPIPEYFGNLLTDLLGLEGAAATIYELSAIATPVFYYVISVWIVVVVLRVLRGSYAFARLGKRGLSIGGKSSVHQSLWMTFTKVFSNLSFGIASLEVHSGNPGDHFLDRLAHLIVRGTKILMFPRDGRLITERIFQKNAEKSASQAKGMPKPDIVMIGRNPNYRPGTAHEFITLTTRSFPLPLFMRDWAHDLQQQYQLSLDDARLLAITNALLEFPVTYNAAAYQSVVTQLADQFGLQGAPRDALVACMRDDHERLLAPFRDPQVCKRVRLMQALHSNHVDTLAELAAGQVVAWRMGSTVSILRNPLVRFLYVPTKLICGKLLAGFLFLVYDMSRTLSAKIHTTASPSSAAKVLQLISQHFPRHEKPSADGKAMVLPFDVIGDEPIEFINDAVDAVETVDVEEAGEVVPNGTAGIEPVTVTPDSNTPTKDELIDRLARLSPLYAEDARRYSAEYSRELLLQLEIDEKLRRARSQWPAPASELKMRPLKDRTKAQIVRQITSITSLYSSKKLMRMTKAQLLQLEVNEYDEMKRRNRAWHRMLVAIESSPQLMTSDQRVRFLNRISQTLDRLEFHNTGDLEAFLFEQVTALAVGSRSPVALERAARRGPHWRLSDVLASFKRIRTLLVQWKGEASASDAELTETITRTQELVGQIRSQFRSIRNGEAQLLPAMLAIRALLDRTQRLVLNGINQMIAQRRASTPDFDAEAERRLRAAPTIGGILESLEGIYRVLGVGTPPALPPQSEFEKFRERVFAEPSSNEVPPLRQMRHDLLADQERVTRWQESYRLALAERAILSSNGEDTVLLTALLEYYTAWLALIQRADPFPEDALEGLERVKAFTDRRLRTLEATSETAGRIRWVRERLALAGEYVPAFQAKPVWVGAGVPQDASAEQRIDIGSRITRAFPPTVRAHVIFESAAKGDVSRATRQLASRGADLILDASAPDTNAFERLLARLVERQDAQDFAFFSAFWDRLNSDDARDFSSDELRRIVAYLADRLPAAQSHFESQARLVRYAASAQSAEKLAARIDRDFATKLLSASAPRPSSVSDAAIAEDLRLYLNGSSTDPVQESGILPRRLALALARQVRVKLLHRDPSFRVDLSDIRSLPGSTQLNVITDLPVFAHDLDGVAYALRIEKLEREFPGRFGQALLVRDPLLQSPEKVLARYPEARIYQGRFIFAVDRTEFSEGLNRLGYNPQDSILVTADDRAEALLPAERSPMLLTVRDPHAQSLRSTAGALESAVKLLANPALGSRAIRKVAEGRYVFLLPQALPLEFWTLLQRVATAAVDLSA